jgi:hypothetical protein
LNDKRDQDFTQQEPEQSANTMAQFARKPGFGPSKPANLNTSLPQITNILNGLDALYGRPNSLEILANILPAGPKDHRKKLQYFH